MDLMIGLLATAVYVAFAVGLFYYLVAHWIGLGHRPVPRVGFSVVIGMFVTYVALGSATGLYNPILRLPEGPGVLFAEAGSPCTRDELYLDSDTGSQLACAGHASGGGFSESEVEQIVVMAEKLASDEDGLTKADRAQVDEFAKELKRR